jgi:hypothetical protein
VNWGQIQKGIAVGSNLRFGQYQCLRQVNWSSMCWLEMSGCWLPVHVVVCVGIIAGRNGNLKLYKYWKTIVRQRTIHKYQSTIIVQQLYNNCTINEQ